MAQRNAKTASEKQNACAKHGHMEARNGEDMHGGGADKGFARRFIQFVSHSKHHGGVYRGACFVLDSAGKELFQAVTPSEKTAPYPCPALWGMVLQYFKHDKSLACSSDAVVGRIETFGLKIQHRSIKLKLFSIADGAFRWKKSKQSATARHPSR